jgi:hypothetical protein
MIQTLAFLALSSLFAWLLWQDRPAVPRPRGLRLLRTWCIIALPWGAFLGASLADRGDQLSVGLKTLRIPLAAVAEASQAQSRPYLVVGDRPEEADLVVRPYADEGLSRISLPANPRNFVTVEAAVSDVEGNSRLEARLLLQSFDPVPELEFPGMAVIVDNRRIEPGAPQAIELAEGRWHRISIERVDIDGDEQPRRSFRLGLVPGRNPAVELRLDTALAADAGSCAEPRLRLSPAASGDATEPLFRDPENLVFTSLGGGGDHPLLEPASLGPVAEAATLCAQARTRFSWPRTAVESEARLELVSQRTFLPWFCCLFVSFAALAMHLLCARAWSEPTPERILVPFLQWILALRLLAAIAGYYNDTSLVPANVLWDGLSAFICLPVLAVVALRSGTGAELSPLMQRLALLVASGLFGSYFYLGEVDWPPFGVLLCGVTVVAALLRMRLKSEPAPLALAANALARRLRAAGQADGETAAPPAETPLARATAWLRTQPPALRLGLGVLAVLVAARGLLIAGDITERWGIVPLSLIYVPGAILGMALLLDGARATKERVALPAVLASFLFAYLVVPIAARDTGAIFVFSVPVAFGLLAFRLGQSWPRPDGKRFLRTAAWALPAAAPFVIVAGYSLILYAPGPIPSPAPPTEARFLTQTQDRTVSLAHLGPHIARVAEWDRNEVRLLAFLAPAEVEMLGTEHAFESLDLMTSLGPLTAGLFGQGYLAPSNIRHSVLENQYFENLPAAHLIWPVGRMGVLGLLIVLAAGLAAIRPWRPSDPEDQVWPRVVASLASATFLWAAVYMVLANLNWVPFTGRNVYLLAVTSAGDLPEGFALLMLACLACFGRAAAKGE